MKRILLSSVLSCMLVGSIQANTLENSKNFLSGALDTGLTTFTVGLFTFLMNFCICETLSEPPFTEKEFHLGEAPTSICWSITSGTAALPLMIALKQGFPENMSKMTLAGSLSASAILSAYTGIKSFKSWGKTISEWKESPTK